MLKAGDPVDIKLWTKSGEIQEWRNCIPLRYNFYKGTQQFKLLNSWQIRQARICCIFRGKRIGNFSLNFSVEEKCLPLQCLVISNFR